MFKLINLGDINICTSNSMSAVYEGKDGKYCALEGFL